MSFLLSHWNAPRTTIASKYKNNDYGYAMHGAKCAAEVIRYINCTPQQMLESTILDYGCGTARIATVLSFMFKSCYAYDPNKKCIEEAKRDIFKTGFPCNNITMAHSLPSEQYDYLCSINVLEHLDQKSFVEAMQNITSLTKVGAVLWYSIAKNPLMNFFITESTVKADGKNIEVCYLTKQELDDGIQKLLNLT